MEQMKYNISTPELKDLETQVISLLKKRITFTKRPDDHPFSFLIYQCKSKAESALAQVLDIPKNLPKPSVIIRPYQPGVHQVVSKVLTVDPGNDLEAVVDVEAMSTKNLEKLADPQTLKQFDQAFEDAMSGDLVMKGLANFHPALPMEYTSSSVTGDYSSMGWHTVCRRDKADQTMNGYGTSQTVNDQTLNSCSTWGSSRVSVERNVPSMWRLTALWLLIVLSVAEDDCELERIEESEAVALNTQLLQQKLHLVAGDEVVPPAERFSLPVARAFAALSQAAFCALAALTQGMWSSTIPVEGWLLHGGSV
eukprot:symbB.v1.2.040423.t1/scaffold7220.1/size12555/1